MSLSTHQALVDVVYHEARCIDEQRWDERRDKWLNGEEPSVSLPAELGSLSL